MERAIPSPADIFFEEIPPFRHGGLVPPSPPSPSPPLSPTPNLAGTFSVSTTAPAPLSPLPMPSALPSSPLPVACDATAPLSALPAPSCVPSANPPSVAAPPLPRAGSVFCSRFPRVLLECAQPTPLLSPPAATALALAPTPAPILPPHRLFFKQDCRFRVPRLCFGLRLYVRPPHHPAVSARQEALSDLACALVLDNLAEVSPAPCFLRADITGKNATDALDNQRYQQ